MSDIPERFIPRRTTTERIASALLLLKKSGLRADPSGAQAAAVLLAAITPHNPVCTEGAIARLSAIVGDIKRATGCAHADVDPLAAALAMMDRIAEVEAVKRAEREQQIADDISVAEVSMDELVDTLADRVAANLASRVQPAAPPPVEEPPADPTPPVEEAADTAPPMEEAAAPADAPPPVQPDAAPTEKPKKPRAPKKAE